MEESHNPERSESRLDNHTRIPILELKRKAIAYKTTVGKSVRIEVQMTLRDRYEITAFRNAAQKYCSHIESKPTDIDSWGEEVLLSLSMLYAFGGLLPHENSFPDDFPSLPDEYIISHDEWAQLFGKLSLILHLQRSGWKCHSCPDTAEQHEISGILADNLADIYRAIKPGLRAWESGVSEYLPSILLEWKLGYRTNWGFDAVEALKELHPLVYSVGFKNTT